MTPLPRAADEAAAGAEQGVADTQGGQQFCFSFDMALWEAMRAVVAPQECMMRDRGTGCCAAAAAAPQGGRGASKRQRV